MNNESTGAFVWNRAPLTDATMEDRTVYELFYGALRGSGDYLVREFWTGGRWDGNGEPPATRERWHEFYVVRKDGTRSKLTMREFLRRKRGDDGAEVLRQDLPEGLRY